MTFTPGNVLYIRLKEDDYLQNEIPVTIAFHEGVLCLTPLIPDDTYIPVADVEKFFYLPMKEGYKTAGRFYDYLVGKLDAKDYRAAWQKLVQYNRRTSYCVGNLLCVRPKGATDAFFANNGPFIAIVDSPAGLCMQPLLLADTILMPVSALELFDHVLVNSDYLDSTRSFDDIIRHLGIDEYRIAWMELYRHWQQHQHSTL